MPQSVPHTQKLYTKTFWILCISYAFFGGSFNMIIPELPSFLSALGGEDYKGLIIALFTLTAGLSRPFSGKLTDLIGRKPIIIIGTIVCIICSLLYPILTTISGFMLLRLVHGFSTGFSPTAMTAYIADIVPEHRRGEAMGIIGVSINLGSSISPPLGSYLATHHSLNMMFYASSLFAVISFLLVWNIKETIAAPKPFKPKMLVLQRDEIISKQAILPALVCGLSYLGFGAIITITPDQSEFLGITNKGLYFSSFTLCSILSRLVAGQVSDRYGRIIVMKVAVALLALAYLCFGYAESPSWLLAGSGFIGFSLGIAMPAVFAWTVDRSNDSNRGKSMATLFIGLEIAIGTGALIGAAIYDNDPSNFKRVFQVVSVITIFAILFVKERKSNLTIPTS
ncbi:MAG: MFS family permease [Saprospiraceae bacterium]|jgi:MFS family permease